MAKPHYRFVQNPMKPKPAKKLKTGDAVEWHKRATCFNCGKKGHVYKNCTKPKKPRKDKKRSKSSEDNNEEELKLPRNGKLNSAKTARIVTFVQSKKSGKTVEKSDNEECDHYVLSSIEFILDNASLVNICNDERIFVEINRG